MSPREWLCSGCVAISKDAVRRVSIEGCQSRIEAEPRAAIRTGDRVRLSHILLDVHRGRYEFPELRRLVIDHAWEWKADRVAIEDAGSGTSLIQDLRQRGDLRVDPVTPRGEKVERVNGQTAKIEAGRVLLPAEAPWLTTFIDEVRAFPSAKYDDQVDSMANFLRYDLKFAQLIKDGGRKWALRSKNPARPGVEPAGTARVTIIGSRRLWER